MITTLSIICVALAVIGLLNNFLRSIPNSWFIGAYGLLLLFYIARWAHRTFFKAQSRLGELLLTTFVAGALMAAVAPQVPSERSDVMAVLAAVCIGWAFCGAAWGWHAAQRLGETNPRKRLWLLANAWLFILSASGAIASGIILPPKTHTPLELALALVAFVLCLALCVPAVLVELRCREGDKNVEKAPAPLLPSDKSRSPSTFALIISAPIQLLIGPLIVKANTWITPKGNAAPKPLNELPENVAKVFAEAGEELQPEGLAPVAYLDYGKRTDSTSMWTMLLCNRERGDMAAVTFLDTRAQKIVMTHSLAVFFSQCQDQERVVTNRTDAGLLPSKPNVRAFHFPAATDLRSLYRIHRAWMEHEFKSAELTLPAPGDEVKHYGELDERALQYIAGVGLMFLESKSGKYRMTWRGACLLMWKSTFPWKQFLHARQRHEAAELCKMLGMQYPS
jgi:hypothetical protein